MRLVRTWPREIPEGRSYVVDDCERVVIDNYDHTILGDIDDDLLIIEWDIAASPNDLLHFAELARQHPADVLVAPYKLYAYPGDREWMAKWQRFFDPAGGVWAHFKYDDEGLVLDPIRDGDPFCHWFGFGLTYLPRDLIRQYLAAVARFPALKRFTDSSFDAWHYANVKHDVPVAWDVRPVHLHYSTRGLEL